MHSFVILTGTRTGSTLFYRTLDAHPDLEAHGEMFLDDPRKRNTYHKSLARSAERSALAERDPEASIEAYLDELLQPTGDAAAVGFKLMYDDMPAALESVLRRRKPHVIHLVRRNALKRRVSQVAANLRGVFHVETGKQAPSGPIRLEVDTLVDELRTREHRVQLGREFARSFDHNIEVYYEDMVENREAMFAPVFEFLDVPNVALAPPAFQKINPDSLTNLIENYDEVVAVLNGTEFERDLA